MITDLWIENFKGIGRRQHIPLRPITLLFGRNSAGKSSVLHALQYLKAIITDRRFDPVGDIDGPHTVSLGGFARARHRHAHKDNKDVVLRIRREVSDTEQARFRLDQQRRYRYIIQASDFRGDWQAAMDNFTEKFGAFANAPSTITVELRLRLSHTSLQPTVSQFILEADDQPFVSLYLRNDGTANGWANLYSTVWGTPPFPDLWFHLQKETPSSFITWMLRALNERAIDVQNKYATALIAALTGSAVADDSHFSANNHGTVLATDLLQCPRILHLRTSYHDTLAEFSSNSLICEQYGVIDWSEFLDKCWCTGAGRWKGADNVIKMIGDAQAKIVVDHTLLKELQNEDYATLAERLSTTYCLGPLALLASEELATDAVEMLLGLIREYWTNLLVGGLTEGGSHFQGPWTFPIRVDLNESALPYWDRPFRPTIDQEHAPSVHFGPISPDDIASDWPQIIEDTVPLFVATAMKWISTSLSETIYLGPKRSTVPRHLSTQFMESVAHWGAGLAAWRWLLSADDKSFARCSEWLHRLGESDADHQPSGYTLTRVRFLEMPLTDMGRFVTDSKNSMLQNNPQHTRLVLQDRRSGCDLLPQEVGEGVTQVVPVIVAAVSLADRMQRPLALVAIEQPELHLHPSMAAKLGDLFVESAVRSEGAVLLSETHSEHLILRILRRIRQTTNGELPEHIPSVRPEDVCVLWVDNLGDGTTFQRLRIDDQGEFIDRWPRGFFSERAEELF